MYHSMNTHPPRAGIVKPPCACFFSPPPGAPGAAAALRRRRPRARLRPVLPGRSGENERTNERTSQRTRATFGASEAERATAERETTAHAAPARWRPRPSRDTDTTNRRGSVSCTEHTRNDPSIDRSIVMFAEIENEFATKHLPLLARGATLRKANTAARSRAARIVRTMRPSPTDDATKHL